MDKTTTKVRIVFDCSDKYDAISLNDVIYAGPKLQRELIDVLRLQDTFASVFRRIAIAHLI